MKQNAIRQNTKYTLFSLHYFHPYPFSFPTLYRLGLFVANYSIIVLLFYVFNALIFCFCDTCPFCSSNIFSSPTNLSITDFVMN